MKLVCSKANLLNGVQTVSKAVPSKTTMSILECILVDATNGEINDTLFYDLSFYGSLDTKFHIVGS